MRDFIATASYGMGVAGVTVGMTAIAAHFAYDGPISWSNGILVSIVSVILLITGAGLLSMTPRLALLPVTVLGGASLAVSPIRHTGFSGWGPPDLLTCLAGVLLLGLSYLWFKAMTAPK